MDIDGSICSSTANQYFIFNLSNRNSYMNQRLHRYIMERPTTIQRRLSHDKNFVLMVLILFAVLCLSFWAGYISSNLHNRVATLKLTHIFPRLRSHPDVIWEEKIARENSEIEMIRKINEKVKKLIEFEDMQKIQSEGQQNENNLAQQFAEVYVNNNKQNNQQYEGKATNATDIT